MPLGTSQYEKRGIATHLPVWDKSECIQCNRCSFVCPHAVIRPYLLNEDEVKNAPAGLELTDAKGPQLAGLRYTMGVSTLDCTCLLYTSHRLQSLPHHRGPAIL